MPTAGICRVLYTHASLMWDRRPSARRPVSMQRKALTNTPPDVVEVKMSRKDDARERRFFAITSRARNAKMKWGNVDPMHARIRPSAAEGTEE